MEPLMPAKCDGRGGNALMRRNIGAGATGHVQAQGSQMTLRL